MFAPLCLDSDPNIYGYFGLSGVKSIEEGISAGAFSFEAFSEQINNAILPEHELPKVVFNASNGNALYSGDQLQASALQLLACIKV